MNQSNVKFAVEMRGISKFFANTRALCNVDLNVRKGSIHALLGENGAGKSTLMKILYGLHDPDTGYIKVNGIEQKIRNPKEAIKLGIGMVHQHFMLVENFTITENIILGNEITGSMGILDVKEANQRIRELGETYGLEVDPSAKVQDVSVATQQRVEILKALYRGADILILDEPTAVLTPQEIDKLIHTLHRLQEDGMTIIIITHKLREIKEVAKYCTIIRRGELIDTVLVDKVSQNDLASMMVGHEVNLNTEKCEATPGEVVFEINNLSVVDNRGVEKVKNLSLQVNKGEIVAIAGVDGNGQTELVEAITGLTKARSGKITMNGKEITNQETAEIHKAGIYTIHEDRQKRGLVLDFNVAENLILEASEKDPFSKKGILQWKNINGHAEEMVGKYDIRPSDSAQLKAGGLSGGNQQKVIIAREVEANPDLLIACQPTRGLDVGAIEFVRNTLVKQRDAGKAVLLVSLELDEVFDLADRIKVIYDGAIVADLDPTCTSEQEVGLFMAGGSHEK